MSASRSCSPSRRELTLVAAALLAAACGGHARPYVVGRYLVYSGEFQTAGEPAVVLARADGGDAHTIAHGERPALSPDGRWVAFNRPQGLREKLFVVATSGGKPRLLARTDLWPMWSPASDRIVTYKGDALVSIDLHGHVTVLARTTPGDWTVSPDGRWVAYISGSEQESDLFVVRVSGGDRRLVTRHANYSPVWGRHWIAFVRPGGIWRIHPDGSGLERILRAPRHPERTGIWGFDPVAWAPGGGALLANIASPNAWDVAIRIDVPSGRYRRLFGYAISLSRDGKFALVQVGPGGGPRIQVRPQKVLAFPFTRRGHSRLLARGEVCCPSWNR